MIKRYVAVHILLPKNSLGSDIRCTFAAAMHFFQFSLLKDYWLSLHRAISYLIAQLI